VIWSDIIHDLKHISDHKVERCVVFNNSNGVTNMLVCFCDASAHRRRKWGRRGRARGPNILASCRFGAAVFKYASSLFYYQDTEIRISPRSRVIKIPMV